jgi:hypothetical protein
MSDRRDFLKSAARGIAGALLVGGTGWLALGKGEPCWTNGACRGCPQLDGCPESEARLTRLQRRPRPNVSHAGRTGEEPMDS